MGNAPLSRACHVMNRRTDSTADCARSSGAMPASIAASELDIAYNTARSHLRAIFAKTGTHRQVQLVTLLRTVGNE